MSAPALPAGIKCSEMIKALEQVIKTEGDLPCILRDALGIYSSLNPLTITVMDEWKVMDAELPPGVGIGSKVVCWE
jgi:hypothetical protein